MQKLLLVAGLLLFVFSSCKEEELTPAPSWNEDWCMFSGTFHRTSDTVNVAFSSGQGYSCSAGAHFENSLLPWEDEATCTSSLNGVPAFALRRGVLMFDGMNSDDVPEDTAIINYFRPGHYTLSPDARNGFDIVYTDPDGWIFTSGNYISTYGSNYMYTCRISGSRAFTRSGIQYVKVRMHFENVMLCHSSSGDVIELEHGDFEGFFKND